MLIPHLGGGGAEHVTALLAQRLSREKYELHLGLVTQQGGGEDMPQWVTVHTLGTRRVRNAAMQLVRLVRQTQPDVILSGMAHLNFLVLLLRPFFPCKTRVLVRQNGTVSSVLASGGVPRYTRLLYKALYPRADRIICQSQGMAEDLARVLRIDKAKIAVLPNPVDLNRIRIASDGADHWAKLGSSEGPRLLAVGRLAPEKGFDLLLQAFVLVREQFPHARLTIAGTGPEEAWLKAQCRSLRLDSAVHFLGYIKQPCTWHSRASLFVLSSRQEGMPNALLEALAGGLPVVATPASGGIVDLLSGQPGTWLIPEISAAALASTLIEALGSLHPSLRANSATRFAHRFIDQFSIESALAAYETLIDTTCIEAGRSHLALIIPTLDRIAGAEQQVMLLAKGLRSRGWRVSVIALSGNGGVVAKELEAAGATFMSLQMRKGLADPRGWLRFIRWLRREKPDVVHAHLPHAAWLARWSRLLAPVPVVIDTLHSSSTGTAGRRQGYRISRNLPDQVTAVSHAVAGSHLAAKIVRPENLAVLHNGVDVNEWRPCEKARATLRHELGLKNQFVWLAAGRLEPVKDYPTLLVAMARVPQPAQLVIAGHGPLLNDLVQLSSRLGLDGRVRFLGYEPNLRRWMQPADGFVLTSRWEGLPMVLLEAGACALPAVATDVPGTREVILDNQTGMLVPAANPDELTRAMTAMMRLPAEQRHAIGARARQRIEEQFSLTHAFDRWEELYCKLLQAKSREPVTHRSANPATVDDSTSAS